MSDFEIHALQERMVEMDRQIKDLQRQVDVNEAAHDGVVRVYEKRIDDLANEVTALRLAAKR